MVLHAFLRPVTPFATLSRRGLSLPMHLHENRPMKRAGEAGKALRASGKVFIKSYLISQPERVAALRGFAGVSVGSAVLFGSMTSL
ncbi:TPA: hypothetical protein MIT52_25815 [Klebsiella quasipneumoniae]|nr:hypothetical protein [Klebsiella quasipneumoniae]